ncbi:isochorismate synthase [Ferroacidibacillus organovorans]|uniref:isochorismate synthase n=1 Tax=Ferroacidibacillus organovorans TaxID=1765683 RepID=A0A853KAI9_9BACL|nr:isochorismate synthase [Ferroacidibacillus organovorans]KYP80981.1 hypothetical protein AYJ22_09365 [Ferroacidibacillus organovorans]OAG93481.1 hypothetical protein AYW79_10410 [Ferroacidibacillus organovorans]
MVLTLHHVTVEEVYALLEPLLQKGSSEAKRKGHSVMVSASVPITFEGSLASVVDMGLKDAQFATYWHDGPNGLERATYGETALEIYSGARAFDRASTASVRLFQEVITGETARTAAFLGTAFDASRKRGTPWERWPDVLLAIPMFSIERETSARAYLTVTLRVGQNDTLRDVKKSTEQALRKLLELSTQKRTVRRRGSGLGDLRIDEAQAPEAGIDEAYRTLVSQATEDMRKGSYEKVVHARMMDVTHRVTAFAATLENLAYDHPSSTVFGIAWRGDVFLGATPERLVGMRKGQLYIDCLAGTAPRFADREQDEQAGQALLASKKDLHEHRLVLAGIESALEGVATKPTYKDPQLRRLPNLQHLYTPVRAEALRDVTIVSVAARLQPTPAVAGWPRAKALRVIREREEVDRGWYAGALGFIERDGSGEMVVALRSALVKDDRAYLFAGAGLVADSDPIREEGETTLKMQVMKRALCLSSEEKNAKEDPRES